MRKTKTNFSRLIAFLKQQKMFLLSFFAVLLVYNLFIYQSFSWKLDLFLIAFWAIIVLLLQLTPILNFRLALILFIVAFLGHFQDLWGIVEKNASWVIVFLLFGLLQLLLKTDFREE